MRRRAAKQRVRRATRHLAASRLHPKAQAFIQKTDKRKLKTCLSKYTDLEEAFPDRTPAQSSNT
jgi:hypothetical protein